MFDLKYHLVWCTKCRYKILKGPVAERVRDLIRQIYQSRDVVIVRGAVSPDHIHVLLAAPSSLAPVKLAQLHQRAVVAELRRRYWGLHTWPRGNFCATVGAVDKATIRAYIENQTWDEDEEGFKITATTEP